MTDVYVVALGGPSETRAQAEVALESAGIPQLPSDHHARENWASKFPEDQHEFITCVCDDINQPTQAVEPAGWVLRVHYPMPDEPKPSVEQVLTANIEEMRAEIAALKAKVG